MHQDRHRHTHQDVINGVSKARGIHQARHLCGVSNAFYVYGCKDEHMSDDLPVEGDLFPDLFRVPRV